MVGGVLSCLFGVLLSGCQDNDPLAPEPVREAPDPQAAKVDLGADTLPDPVGELYRDCGLLRVHLEGEFPTAKVEEVAGCAGALTVQVLGARPLGRDDGVGPWYGRFELSLALVNRSEQDVFGGPAVLLLDLTRLAVEPPSRHPTRNREKGRGSGSLRQEHGDAASPEELFVATSYGSVTVASPEGWMPASDPLGVAPYWALETDVNDSSQVAHLASGSRSSSKEIDLALLGDVGGFSIPFHVRAPLVARSVSASIGTAGGEIVVPETGVVLTIPPGALLEDRMIQVTAHFGPGPEGIAGDAGSGRWVSLEPEGLLFGTPVQLRIAYPREADDPQGGADDTQEWAIRTYAAETESLEWLPTAVDHGGGTLATELTRFPLYVAADRRRALLAGSTQLSAGLDHDCMLGGDGAVQCWGRNDFGQATAPEGTFTQVSAGIGHHTCGLKSDGSVRCWGNDVSGQTDAPAGVFTQVSAGGHTCALKEDGGILCWGHNLFGQATPPEGTFTQVSAGELHTCALTRDGSVQCWGYDASGQATAPAGSFTQVSAGDLHTCALTTDGRVECWGSNALGQSSAPEGAFTQVSAGGYHTCALRTDGSVQCWGLNDSGQAAAPAGSFTQVSAGGGFKGHTCAQKTDRSVRCWGDDSFGQVEASLSLLAAQPPSVEAGMLGAEAGGAGTVVGSPGAKEPAPVRRD